MANSLYGLFKQNLLNGDIALDSTNVRVVLVDTSAYSVSINTHDFLDDIPGGARIAVSGNLANKTTSLGIFDADDITISAVSGATVEAVVLYIHTGTDSTSHLIAYIDTGTGLPFTPNGGDVLVSWSNSGTKIFEV